MATLTVLWLHDYTWHSRIWTLAKNERYPKGYAISKQSLTFCQKEPNPIIPDTVCGDSLPVVCSPMNKRFIMLLLDKKYNYKLATSHTHC